LSLYTDDQQIATGEANHALSIRRRNSIDLVERNIPMRPSTNSLLTNVLLRLSLAAIAAVVLSSVPASAQERTNPASGRAPSGGLRPLSEIVAQMNRSKGVIVLADWTVQSAPVIPLRQATTTDNVELQVKSLLNQLPAGALWVKLYLPEPASKRWDADAMTQYVQAQARLLERRVGADMPAGTLEIMGQQVSTERGKEIIDHLQLKLVYLITNPSLRPMASQEQRNSFVQRIRQMDSAARLQLMRNLQDQIGPQMDMVRMIAEGLSDEERIQLKQDPGRN
jgi:hypothetical protein